jgi:hypothetical protein
MVGGAGNAIYLSRQGDFTDWGYGADVEDLGRAMVMQLGRASEIGNVPTAFMPFEDSSVLAATARSLWLLQGDSVAGGSLKNISRGIGIIGPHAWCAINDAQIGGGLVSHGFMFLSSLGPFLVSPSGDGLHPIGKDRVPEELIDIPGTTTVSMAYSPDERGVYIFLTPESGDGTHWFFNLENQSFWPVVFQTGHQPYSACWHDGQMVLGCNDGTLRYVGGNDDDGDGIDSYVLIGPIRLAGPNMFGILMTIHGMIGAGSGTVLWEIVAGDTAEEACVNGKAAITAYLAGNAADAYTWASGAWAAGRSFTSYPRVRAMWICVLLKSSSPWAYESITTQFRDAGNWR